MPIVQFIYYGKILHYLKNQISRTFTYDFNEYYVKKLIKTWCTVN